MQEEKQGLWAKIGAYFIIAIMIFSVFGFGLYFSSGNKKTNNENKTVKPNPQDLQPMQFTADINGNVIKILNRFTIFAYTNESDISKIDKEILKLKNIENIDSHFSINQQAQIKATYTYIANVSGMDLTKNILENEIKDVNILENPIIYPFADVNVPQIITFENKDLNLEKKYDIDKTTIQAIVSPNTKKGDLINIKAYATFINNSLTKLVAEEQKNFSLEPKTFEFATPYKFNFEKTIVLLNGEDLNKVDLNKYKEKDFNLNSFGKMSYFETNDKNIDLFLENLNKDLNDLNITKNVFWQGNIFVKSVPFKKQIMDYNKEVYAQIPYNKFDINKNITFQLKVTKIRDEIVNIQAIPLNINFNAKKGGN